MLWELCFSFFDNYTKLSGANSYLLGGAIAFLFAVYDFFTQTHWRSLTARSVSVRRMLPQRKELKKKSHELLKIYVNFLDYAFSLRVCLL